MPTRLAPRSSSPLAPRLAPGLPPQSSSGLAPRRAPRVAPRLAALLALALAITPATTLAQAEASLPPLTVDHELIDQLCGAAAADEAELSNCVDAVGAALSAMTAELTNEERTLLDQAAELVDQTLEDLRAVDVEAILADAVQDLQEVEIDFDVDVQRALEDAIAALEGLDAGEIAVDAQQAIEDAVGEVLAATQDIDLGTAIDEALAEVQSAIDEAGLQETVDDAVAALEESVAQAQAVVAEAQAWARQNRDAVCRGGSISLGTTVGLAVFALTGVEWLGLQAFWATERFTNATCGDVVGEEMPSEDAAGE